MEMAVGNMGGMPTSTERSRGATKPTTAPQTPPHKKPHSSLADSFRSTGNQRYLTIQFTHMYIPFLCFLF